MSSRSWDFPSLLQPEGLVYLHAFPLSWTCQTVFTFPGQGPSWLWASSGTLQEVSARALPSGHARTRNGDNEYKNTNNLKPPPPPKRSLLGEVCPSGRGFR